MSIRNDTIERGRCESLVIAKHDYHDLDVEIATLAKEGWQTVKRWHDRKEDLWCCRLERECEE